jgi:hypothetical protein
MRHHQSQQFSPRHCLIHAVEIHFPLALPAKPFRTRPWRHCLLLPSPSLLTGRLIRARFMSGTFTVFPGTIPSLLDSADFKICESWGNSAILNLPLASNAAESKGCALMV